VNKRGAVAPPPSARTSITAKRGTILALTGVGLWPKRFIGAGITIAIVGVGLWISVGLFRAPPSVVVPANLQDLDPQLADYLRQHIAWARENPRDSQRHASLGLVYEANDRWADAKACFANAAHLDPGNFLAIYHHAIVAQELGDRQEAVHLLQRVVSLQPDLAPARHRLGVLLLDEGKIDEARAAFERVAVLAPESPAADVGLADIALREKDFPRAARLLEQALKRDSKDRKTHYLLGSAYRGMGRAEEAQRHMRLGAAAQQRFMPDAWSETVDKHKKGAADQIQRARRYLDAGSRDRAAEILEALVAWHPENVEARNNLAVVYLELSRPEDALKQLQDAVSRDPQNMGTHINLAACHLKQGQHEVALRYADRAIELGGDSAQGYITKAHILLKLLRNEEAIEAMEKATEIEPQNRPAHYDLGITLLALGRFSEARDRMTRVTELDPDHVDAWVYVCDLSIMLKDYDRAARDIESLRKFAPDDARLHQLIKKLEKSKVS